MQTKTQYGLRQKRNGNILGFEIEPTHIEVTEYMRGNEKEYQLSESSEHLWLVDTFEHAVYVQYNSGHKFDSNFDNPIHSFKPEQLEVVKVETIINIIKVEQLKTLNVKLNEGYNEEHCQFYKSNGNPSGCILTKKMKDIKLTVVDKGDFYYILKSDIPLGLGGYIYNSVKKKDFIIVA